MADDGWRMTDRKERMRRFPAAFLASVIGHLSSAILVAYDIADPKRLRKVARRIAKSGMADDQWPMIE